MPDAAGSGPAGISRLATSRSEGARLLFSQLPILSSGWLASSERSLLNRIEELRRELLTSDAEIDTLDYGAVAPGEIFSAEEIKHGRWRRERVGELCRKSSQGAQEGIFLYRVVRLLRPLLCLELGTCLGITAAYIGSALELNGSGSLISIEGCPRLAEIASENLQRLILRNVSVKNGRFHDVLPELVSSATFDFAYIDGHHDGEATTRYFDLIASSGADDMAFVIDDIGWSEGMKAAWAAITGSQRTQASGKFKGFGICFTSPHG
jgi:predicted O-methyltransferase YrrM